MRLYFTQLLIVIFTCLQLQVLSNPAISILTCGTGQDLYSIYGHSAIRIIDSVNGTDKVYNYGTFNFNDPDFYIKFTRGKLMYYVSDEDFSDFLSLYMHEQRSMIEQQLDLTDSDAKLIQAFLLTNIKEENKYYKYDFLFDNCSTRIRDIFDMQLRGRFVLGKCMADDSLSFRKLLNYYERNLHWERVGINLLMSNLVDKKMSSKEATFLPDYLMKALQQSTLDGKPIVKETIQLLPQPHNPIKTPNHPRQLMWALLLFFVGVSFSSFKKYLLYADVLLFMSLGLLGIFMLLMWLGTEHAVCQWNRNLVWAFPLHIVFAYYIVRDPAKVSMYARYASWLIIMSMLYNTFAEQRFIPEISPLLLLIVYRLQVYRNNQVKINFGQTIFTGRKL